MIKSISTKYCVVPLNMKYIYENLNISYCTNAKISRGDRILIYICWSFTYFLDFHILKSKLTLIFSFLLNFQILIGILRSISYSNGKNLFFGSLLLYNFRKFEHLYGSKRYFVSMLICCTAYTVNKIYLCKSKLSHLQSTVK